MTLTGTLLSILVGACWLAAVTHLFAGIRRSFSPTHLSFAVFAFATGAQSLSQIWLHHALNAAQYVDAAQWGTTAGAISAAAFAWFARFYTRSDDRIIPAAISVVYLVCAAVNLYLPYGFYFDRLPTLTHFALPWGEYAATHVFGGFRPRLIFTLILNIGTIMYVYYACARQYRRGQHYPATTLAISTSIVLVAMGINVIVAALGMRTLSLSSFGFLVLVLVMMYWLSSDESFRTVVAQASEGIFIADVRGRYLDANAAGTELLGWTRTELCKMHIYDVLLPQDVQHVAAQRDALLAGAVVRGRWRFKRKDGTHFTGELSSRLLPDGRLLGMLRDVTAQEDLMRSLEERVAARTAEYAELNRQLESFAYSVSHDLRAPVRSIGAFASVLLQDHARQLDNEGHRHLQRISAAAGHMNELIEGLLQLAKVSHQALKSENIDLEVLVKDVVRTLREREPERQIDINCVGLPHVSGDPRLLSIAFSNLLENAWKYTSRRSQARVEIGCESGPERIVFYVRDNGTGFDMQFAEHLFEPFRRLHSAKEFPGTGIGLATVARVVERHGGRIWAEAAVDRGATFYFTLGTRAGRDALSHSQQSTPKANVI
ncbi:MAG TPA: ATP-binding protein [Steroidobacteraceae bacterium]|nr:ATP-binding protein [Steroidobacteraceae bacterium]